VLPEQIEVELAIMETAAIPELAVIVMVLETTVGVVTQVAFDVITTDTWSALTSELDVKLEAFVPVFIPFTCH
jgi:hypothetical protein